MARECLGTGVGVTFEELELTINEQNSLMTEEFWVLISPLCEALSCAWYPVGTQKGWEGGVNLCH